MKYKNYLENVLGYTGTTTNIYAKYALELEAIGLDYKELMNVYKDSSNNTKDLFCLLLKDIILILMIQEKMRLYYLKEI